MVVLASPQAVALGRHRSGILRQAHFMTTSEKGLSEPNWGGKVRNDTECKRPQSQEDSLGLTKHLGRQTYRRGAYRPCYDLPN